ncbi:hypothetical protein LTR10_019610 [Elasticomyces elasticus]|uniref:FAD/NAD(P)-binding domain-containing protein n=1 Tax=Exophiala sideris TaxID=1016849 RepID=A0ABR0JPL7_9EURO|nr:hypothetical protein LTR10_019610 [Elasticomyces elasticus]KAK5038123.1 hypothetical protein LTS07_001592 [Exophiala sideris]KAK5044107.1 hypothetical protein LTR13_000463 [Exophiala sideris]KAK5067607.1 hypothetical protein LTR69_001596 [Exophiala sideris]KAK5184154.1 hypothetical protein LTR44_003660 [Eurotiomycetes sp. CCFEE 6388]
MASSDIYDLVVIGAGSSGVVSARFYLDVHPDAKVVVLERDNAVGGVWSSERVYPGFKSQGSTRMGGFSDIPLSPRPEQIDQDDFYDANAMATYLDEYVNKHVYSGQTLRDRIRFGIKVDSLDKTVHGWRVKCVGPSGSQSFETRKVIAASGSTSEANVPEFRGRDTFKGPVVHTLNFGRSRILQREDIKTVAVVGGGKSAADHAYQSVKAGKQVHWIIRKSGKGPGGFSEMKAGGPWHNVTELVCTRFFPNLLFFPGLKPASWWETFIFKTRLGQWVYSKLEHAVTQKTIDTARYDDRPGARDSFSQLKTKSRGFSFIVPLGAISHEDFWDTIAQNVDIHHEDIDRVDAASIILSNGEILEADAIICGTGFNRGCSFFSREQQVELGLPHPEAWDDTETVKEWAKLNAEAEKVVRKRYYSLNPPPEPPENFGDIKPDNTPYRLYQMIAPINGDRSIALVGYGAYSNMFAGSEVAAIWATAYLDGVLKLPCERQREQDVAYVTTYMRLRFPAYGRLGSFFNFDLISQLDRMLDELGLKSHRKSKSWLQDLFLPLLVKDFAGLKDEYLEKYGGGGGTRSA